MSAPAITVLMPVYNAEKYLGEAIDSILAQTFPDFELLIINDGSNDGSEKIILSYKDARIRYVVNEQNIRLIATLNKGIALCSTKYIVRMDADDISQPDRLQVQYDFMEKNTGVAVCGSWFKVIGSEQVVKYVPDHNAIMLKMLYQCHICHPSVIMRRESIETFSDKFDGQMHHAEDYDFFTRIGKRYQLANIQQVLLHYRHHTGSVSSIYKEVQVDNSLLIKKRLFSEIGTDVTSEEMEIFRKISQHEYEKSEAFVTKSKALLEKLLVANERSGFFDKAFLRTALAKFWFNICFNLAPIGAWVKKQYSISPLAAYYNISLQERAKFFLKPLLK